MKRRIIIRSIVALTVCMGMIAMFSTISPAEAKETIKFGCMAPITGMFGGVGEPLTKGALLAAKMINEEEGGILGRKVEILVRDTEIRPAIGVRMARELHKEQGVNLFLGIMSSGVAFALKPVMEEMDTLLITCAAHSNKVTGEHFSKNIFRITDDARTRNYALAAVIHKKFPNVNRWANISPNYSYGHSCWENFSEKMKELNPKFTVVADRWPKFGAGGGYGPHINAIMTAKPEGLYSVLYSGDMVAFMREAKQWGLFDMIKVFTTQQLPWSTPYQLKKEMPDMWFSSNYCQQYNLPLSEKYEKAMIRNYGKKYFDSATGHAEPAFDAVYAYKAAVEKAKSFDIAAVRKALEGITIDTPMGKKWIRAGDHQAYFDMPFVHIVPDASEKIGWKVDWYSTVPGKDHIIPVEEALKR